jgi:hypothetical protein
MKGFCKLSTSCLITNRLIYGVFSKGSPFSMEGGGICPSVVDFTYRILVGRPEAAPEIFTVFA